MKRFLLFASVAVAAASMASAQSIEEAQHSSNLTLEWYASPVEALGDGFASRAGIGTHGSFYGIKQNNGVYRFDKDGSCTQVVKCNTAWVGINCDDAGHVYFRNDKYGWAGPEGAGWFVTADAQFCVFDVESQSLVKENVGIVGGGKCRFDALPHIQGNMVEDYFELSAPVNATTQRVYNWIYSSIDEPSAFEEINIEPFFQAAPWPALADGNSAALINTLGNCQHYSDGDVDYMACLPNANYYLTFSANGWGNNIGLFVFDEEQYQYVFTGKFFNTPNHSAVGGFHIFQYEGENYIVYPTGQPDAGMPSADGFAVMKQELVDTPQNAVPVTQEDLDKTVAIKFGTPDLASGNNWRGINVEPVEGQDGVFTIYFYSAGATMQVWTLDLNGGAGFSDIKADKEAAPVYYNLQGVRVANPENGIFIKVCGDKATKVIK